MYIHIHLVFLNLMNSNLISHFMSVFMTYADEINKLNKNKISLCWIEDLSQEHNVV